MNRKTILFSLALLGGAFILFGLGLKAGRGHIATVRINNDSQQEIASGKLFFDRGMILLEGIKPGKTRDIRMYLDKETEFRTVVYYSGGPVIESVESKLKPGQRVTQSANGRDVLVK